jgi:WD40 repeat protein
MLTRKFVLALVCTLPLSLFAASEAKPVATVPVPCESRLQVLSPAGNQIAVGCKDKTLRLIDVASGAEVHNIDAKSVNGFEYSNDGLWFALSHDDGSAEISPTSVNGATKTFHIPAHAHVESFTDPGRVIVASQDAASQVWDVRDTPRKIATLHNDFGGLTALAFSPDGKLLVTADGDTAIRYYDTSNWRLLHEYRGLLLETFAIAFTKDGKHVLVGGADDQIVELDTASVEERRITKDDGVPFKIIPFGNSGEGLVAYFDGEGRAPSKRSIWNSVTGKSSKIAGPQPSAERLVKGQLWLVTVKDNSIVISSFE